MQIQSIVNLKQALSSEHLADPYPLYHQLRSDDPVHWDESLNAWLATRYTDVVSGLHDNRFSAARCLLDTSRFPEETHALLGPITHTLARQMLFLDPPDHTRLRGLVAKAFTPRVVEGMRTRIQNIVNELLDQAQKGGRMDVIQDFAYPLPALVIAELLGVPPEDWHQFIQWSHSVGMLFGGYGLTPEAVLQAVNDIVEFIGYFRKIIAQKCIAPQDNLLQAMLAASQQGNGLSEEELLGNCVLLLAAGHLTTTYLIANGMLALLRNPDQFQLLRDDPAITPLAVLELLRYDCPIQATSRVAKEGITLHNRYIEAGQEIFFCFGAANRDPAQFIDPDQLDLRRQENRQLAFGHGIHYCIGAPLVRLEAEIVFSTLARRLKNPHLETTHPEWDQSLVFRFMRELVITFE